MVVNELQMFGRRKIYTDVERVTAENVVEVLQKALLTHNENQMEIKYLWDYYCGKTPILGKTKEIRQDINHKIAVNRANEIVTFKRGYGFGEPIQYIRRGQDESLTDDINRLNEYMFQEGKQAKDDRLAEWMYVCGLGIRMALPSKDEGDCPFKIYILDPRNSFVVRYNGLGEKVVMGVKYILRENKTPVYSVYTEDMYFEIENGIVTKSDAHVLGCVPMFEYQTGSARLGSFEIVLPILDAINEAESNRLDDIVQFVNSFLALLGGTIDEETAKKLDEYKMLCLPEGVDAKYLSAALNQADIQVLIDNLYAEVLTICGMPNRNGGSSTSDTGSAVIMRDGWENAEAQMKSVENEFKLSEKEFLKLILRILKDTDGTKLHVKDCTIKFTRRHYDNLQTKSQVLATMLNNPKIHPELAFVSCGLFVDPESAYLQSKQWWEENQKRAEEAFQNEVQGNNEKSTGDKETGTDAGTEGHSGPEEEN
jgi:SPP1 family phage portal protein